MYYSSSNYWFYFWFWYFCGTLLAGCIGFAIGASKNKGFVCFWLGFLLGLPGLIIDIIIVANTEDEQKTNTNLLYSNKMTYQINNEKYLKSMTRVCPMCMSTINKYAQICPHCRTNIYELIANNYQLNNDEFQKNSMYNSSSPMQDVTNNRTIIIKSNKPKTNKIVIRKTEITVKCPHCFTLLTIPVEQKCNTIQCPECEGLFVPTCKE